MNNPLPYALLAAFSGMLVPLQSLANARLAQALGGSLMAALANFVTGSLILLAVAVLFRLGPTAPLASLPRAASPWIWTGGILGIGIVAISAFAVPRLGAASMFAWIIVGQLALSLILDHVGFMMDAPHPMTLPRLAGVILLGAGALLVQRF